jgi:hypothetical protein
MSDVPHSQQFLHSPTRPAAPKLIQPGIFSNVFMLQQVNDEFVLDFLSTLISPHELVARVLLGCFCCDSCLTFFYRIRLLGWLTPSDGPAIDP